MFKCEQTLLARYFNGNNRHQRLVWTIQITELLIADIRTQTYWLFFRSTYVILPENKVYIIYVNVHTNNITIIDTIICIKWKTGIWIPDCTSQFNI